MTPQKKRHDRLKAQGICVCCGQEKVCKGRSRCDACRLKTNQAMRSYNARKKSKGICYTCPAPAAEGRTRCNACRGKFNLYWQDYRKRYKDWFQAVKKKSSVKLRMECLKEYGGACACCGEEMAAFLTLDHIYNDGGKERKEINRSGIDFYRWLKRQGFPKGRYQVLCYNCNMAKSHYGICPHQKMRNE